VYQDCDLYLLDDVFSAVDAHTGSEIFKVLLSLVWDVIFISIFNSFHLALLFELAFQDYTIDDNEVYFG
jgi:ABC-type Mn2+/Zn2+ transport system ATPase subunit